MCFTMGVNITTLHLLQQNRIWERTFYNKKQKKERIKLLFKLNSSVSLNFQVISSFCAELYYAMVCSAVLCLKWQFSCAFISFLIILFAYLIKYRYYIVSFAYHMVLVTVGSIQKPCQCRSFSIETHLHLVFIYKSSY